jgi:hypothetical protein
MLRDELRASLAHVALALREPEEFALAWDREQARYGMWVWAGLAAAAVLGTMSYGMTLGLSAGAAGMASKAILLTAAAGLAWAIPLPALYILHSFGGSRLRASTTLLAALVTTSWGGLALVASVPIGGFFSVAMPSLPVARSVAAWVVLGVNLLVFVGVGVAMSDIFCRVVARLEPDREYQPTWFLLLVALIGGQLYYVFGLFSLPA